MYHFVYVKIAQMYDLCLSEHQNKVLSTQIEDEIENSARKCPDIDRVYS